MIEKTILGCLEEYPNIKKRLFGACKGKNVNFIEYINEVYLKEDQFDKGRKLNEEEKKKNAVLHEKKAKELGEWGKTLDGLIELYEQVNFVEKVSKHTNLVLDEVLHFLEGVDPIYKHEIFSMILPDCYSINDKRTVDDLTVIALEKCDLPTLKKCLGEYTNVPTEDNNKTEREYTQSTLKKLTNVADYLINSGYKVEETVITGLTSYKIRSHQDEFDSDKKKLIKDLEAEIEKSSGLYKIVAERAFDYFNGLYYKIPLNGIKVQIEI